MWIYEIKCPSDILSLMKANIVYEGAAADYVSNVPCSCALIVDVHGVGIGCWIGLISLS